MEHTDLAPQGHHAKKADPALARKIREGGPKAQVIRKTSEQQHATLEVPVAEEQLLRDLQNLNPL